MNKKFIVKQLKLAKEEIKKRLSIENSYGLDMANYENEFTGIFVDMLAKHFINLGCVDIDKEYQNLKSEIEMWLWENSYSIFYKEKPAWIKSKHTKDKTHPYTISIKKPKCFYKYIIKTYKVHFFEKSFTLKEVKALLIKQKELTADSLGIRSEALSYPNDFDKIKSILLNAPLAI